MITDKKIPTIPAEGVEFELTLESIEPLNMVLPDFNPKEWKFTGLPVAPQTRRFKLVSVGNCANLNEVRENLKTHGSIPEGQWRVAFKKAYPRNDRMGPIGFADPSWVNPRDQTYFPVLSGISSVWDSNFYWASCKSVFNEHWRWLVEVNK